MTRDIFFNLGRPKIRKYILKAPFLMCQYVTKMNINQRKQWLGKGPDTKLEEFLEKFQMDFDPPPHFWKIILQIFYNRYGCIYARRYDGQMVWNACLWFTEIGTIKKLPLVQDPEFQNGQLRGFWDLLIWRILICTLPTLICILERSYWPEILAPYPKLNVKNNFFF